MSALSFTAKPIKIAGCLVVLLPKQLSNKLPSRGLVMVKGTINNYPLKTALEPNGRGSHFLKLGEALMNSANLIVRESVDITLESVKDWPEPTVPKDLQIALTGNAKAQKTWNSITPLARWDWIRWINATKNPETRKIRIGKTFSKFNSGIIRPCCFNRTMCTDPEVSDNGVLLD
jgi:hypothetical protein